MVPTIQQRFLKNRDIDFLPLLVIVSTLVTDWVEHENLEVSLRECFFLSMIKRTETLYCF
jgi:hypothetical protein